MKNYLSLAERNNWLACMSIAMYNENILEIWKNNLTKDEVKKLKTSITMTRNALKSIMDRMPVNESTKLKKHAQNFQIKITSETGAKVLEDKALKESEMVQFKTHKFENVMFSVMNTKCCNCKKICYECDIYNLCIDTVLPRYDLEDNCPYAFRSVDKVKKKQSKRAKKKANRYDIDNEEYQYNFIPKGVLINGPK